MQAYPTNRNYSHRHFFLFLDIDSSQYFSTWLSMVGLYYKIRRIQPIGINSH